MVVELLFKARFASGRSYPYFIQVVEIYIFSPTVQAVFGQI